MMCNHIIAIAIFAHRSEDEAEIQIRQTGQSAGWKNARRFDNALRKS